MKITKARLQQIIKEEIESYPATRPAKRRVVDDTPDVIPKRDDEEARKEQERKEAARKEAMKLEREKHRPQAEKLWDILYPGADYSLINVTVDGDDRDDSEADLMRDLFGFMGKDDVHNWPNPLKMNAAEEWIRTRSGEDETALLIGDISQTENIESLAAFIEDKVVKDEGVPEFRAAFETKQLAELATAEEIIRMINKAGGILNPNTGEWQNLPDLKEKEVYKFGREKYVADLKRAFPKLFANSYRLNLRRLSKKKP